MNYKYFSEDGKELSQEEFLSHYSDLYFNGSSFSKANSENAEGRIKQILAKSENDALSEDDIFVILAWKTGNIITSNSDDHIVYKNSWSFEKKKAKIYSNELDIQKITEVVNKLKGGNCSLENYLKEYESFKGLGNVYIITLRYFATRGEDPIYDQYADRAIKAITGNFSGGYGLWINDPDHLDLNDISALSDPRSLIGRNDINLLIKSPNMSSLSKKRVVEVYSQYKESLIKVFGTDYNKRKVDQALWTYGHLFSQSGL